MCVACPRMSLVELRGSEDNTFLSVLCALPGFSSRHHTSAGMTDTGYWAWLYTDRD